MSTTDRGPAARELELREPHWPASLAVLAALLLYVTLPERLTLGPKWLLAGVEAALLIPLTIRSPRRHHSDPAGVRIASLALIAVVNLANIASLILLARLLVSGGSANGRELILSSIQIWLTNVLIFGLWYWELDRGGPGARTRVLQRNPDFLYPQMANAELAGAGWRPTFLDYLYTSLTNATAFSPTDTMPLTAWAKSLMAVQSVASLITVALVAARAVNILS